MPGRERALIVGAGSGLSASLARRCAREGMDVVLAARDTQKLAALASETGATTIACDASRADDKRRSHGDGDPLSREKNVESQLHTPLFRAAIAVPFGSVVALFFAVFRAKTWRFWAKDPVAAAPNWFHALRSSADGHRSLTG